MTDDLDAEVARLTASGWSKPAPALTDDDLAIAKKLLGRDNADRLARRKPGARPFRPAPEVTRYVYFKTPNQPFVDWTIEKIVNGRRVGARHYTWFDDMGALIDALLAAGQDVRQIRIGEPEPPTGLRPISTPPPDPDDIPKRRRMAPPVKPPSQRRAIMAQLARFKL